ncbi:hypothetical protein GCM10025771_04880 [Niveibacterium umoris]|uniref:DUF1289 domain-containing protein n=1 Tax=Niveibacterium umoris TaxID=1193620 RepID=A0A840BT27_9RHOO|nr:DUF1289 domain-containing protein [Niveibacterium umoris]MBB4013966.1 hypothetical protein [Niveibacterium umoris]
MQETTPASPCIGVCRIDPRNGLCEGCQRTLEEIGGWSQAGFAGQRAILQRVAQRRAAAEWFEGDLRGDCDR